MKNTILYSFLCLAFLFFSCEENEILNEELVSDDSEFGLAEARQSRSFVRNDDFETPIDFNQPAGRHATWIKQGYQLNSGLFEWSNNIGNGNSGGVRIETVGGVQNDLAITQMLSLNPSKFYRLSAWVKTVNVIGGAGANVCIWDTWTRSSGLWGTQDWQKISVEFVPPASGEITIACRLGYWAGVSSGTVYFDDVIIEEVPKFVKSSTHIQLILDEEDAAAVRKQTIKNWMANLDRAYEKYYELMGSYPYNGQTITIQSVDSYPGGWAVAGNPILWYKPYIKDELLNTEATGSWSFGILHELAHDFALDNANRSWIWHEEMFANFRMYYVAEGLNAPITQGKTYIGSEIKNFYMTDADDSYAKGIALGIPKGQNGLMYTLIRIKDQTGWQPFINAIRDLNASSVSPATNVERFNLFLDKLSQYSGTNVRDTYLPGELNTIQQLLSQ